MVLKSVKINGKTYFYRSTDAIKLERTKFLSRKDAREIAINKELMRRLKRRKK